MSFKHAGFLLLVALVNGCDTATDPAREQTMPETLLPSFSEACNLNPGQCDAVEDAIENLQMHKNPICQEYGDQAMLRFEDPHSDEQSSEHDRVQ